MIKNESIKCVKTKHRNTGMEGADSRLDGQHKRSNRTSDRSRKGRDTYDVLQREWLRRLCTR